MDLVLKAGQPAFKTKSIHHDQSCQPNGFHIRRLGLEDMRILIGANQGDYADAFATHAGNEVAQDAEARYDGELVRRRAGGGQPQHDNSEYELPEKVHLEFLLM